MQKDELIKAFEHCLKTEESAVPIYTKHISNSLFLSGFLKEEKDKIIQTLEMQKKESERHKKIYEALITKVKQSKQDVY